ncbi:VQ motif-containing protein 11 [Ipomoea triloba]|uniref:VQ motif-containing protein 11 n=1 Tax=Ipomoea triloba TaxID=35885 RepID=UPI00125CED5B|nr:VQ motif-containing protein 11 [Ipomoea triloba]GMC68868.1 VQ motif-containing protein 11 [Ipomoea batatas]
MSSSNPPTTPSAAAAYASSPPALHNSQNTTFVQADPSNFRAVVQRLTGAAQDPAAQKLPVTAPPRFAGEMGPRRPAFKLHERRQAARKLEISLNHHGGPSVMASRPKSPMVMASPVSPLEMLGRGTPRTPKSPMEEEERAIAEKGFYLHPSPLSTPRNGRSDPPELLPLFPLHSPRDHHY